MGWCYRHVTPVHLQWSYCVAVVLAPQYHVDGEAQNCSNSSALAMKLPQSFAKPTLSRHVVIHVYHKTVLIYPVIVICMSVIKPYPSTIPWRLVSTEGIEIWCVNSTVTLVCEQCIIALFTHQSYCRVHTPVTVEFIHWSNAFCTHPLPYSSPISYSVSCCTNASPSCVVLVFLLDVCEFLINHK